MNSNNQSLLKLLIGMVIVAGLIAALLVLSGESNSETPIKIIIIAFSFLFFGITSSVCLAVTRKPEHRMLGGIGIAISFIAFIIITFLVFSDFDGESNGF